MDGVHGQYQRAGWRRLLCGEELEPSEIREAKNDVGKRPGRIELAIVRKEGKDRRLLAFSLARGPRAERHHHDRQSHSRAAHAAAKQTGEPPRHATPRTTLPETPAELDHE